MTCTEFNDKWEAYLSEGDYGLDIHVPPVIDYLDGIFPLIIEKYPDFKYHQIKEKFNTSRFYSNITDIAYRDDRHVRSINIDFVNDITQGIDRLIAEWDSCKIERLEKSLKKRL